MASICGHDIPEPCDQNRQLSHHDTSPVIKAWVYSTLFCFLLGICLEAYIRRSGCRLCLPPLVLLLLLLLMLIAQ